MEWVTAEQALEAMVACNHYVVKNACKYLVD